MDEWTLNDLLECSVCLERLDTSSKVLPCQHTFCKKCLEEILITQKELRCPECRILVDVKIDELPPNVLLMRILEGMRHCGSNKTVNSTATKDSNLTLTSSLSSSKNSPNDFKPANKPLLPPYARAVYDYLSKEPGDLSFKKGDIIVIRKKIDNNWCQGECSGQVGAFPLSYVQVMTSIPKYVPQCKALYDFRMRSDDEEGCLTFSKGDIITVIRRVDDNWAEGKLEDQIGIFPLAFVELNNVARALIKLSVNSEPGTSRIAPPTPVNETTPLIMNIDSSVKLQPVANVSAVPLYGLAGTDTSSSSITSPSSNSTTPTSSSAPSSPASPPHVAAPPLPNKRYSFGSLIANSQQLSQRNSTETANWEVSQPQSLPADVSLTEQNPVLQRQSSRRRGRYFNSELAPSLSCSQINPVNFILPASYVALYPYKPLMADELELKRGAVYTVTERCQDGWFKGISTRNQKSGVFPGNYVAPAKSLPALQAQMRGGLCRNGSSSGVRRTSAPPLEPRSSFGTRQGPCLGDTTQRNTAICATNNSEQPSTTVIAPPNVSVQAAFLTTKLNDKSKEKKEKGGSFMRRLASIKKTKSPPPVSYSMDNPVFEDLSAPVQGVHIRSGSCPNQLLNFSPCDSQSHRLFSPGLPHKSKSKEKTSAYTVPSQTFADPSFVAGVGELIQHRKSQSVDASATTSAENNFSQNASLQCKTSQSSPQGKECFRCIVPYPPNSEYELELKLGDIIYVHKKRDDGWYKGTHSRTGRTGLFPASFVQSV